MKKKEEYSNVEAHHIIFRFVATNESKSWLINLPTNHSLVPLCQWFVSCIGVATWDKWHGSCNRATEWYAYVFAYPWSLLASSTGAKDLPQETWMILMSVLSSLDQQDNLPMTWCVPLVFVSFGCSIDLFWPVDSTPMLLEEQCRTLQPPPVLNGKKWIWKPGKNCRVC